jgi:hypothetical protein
MLKNDLAIDAEKVYNKRLSRDKRETFTFTLQLLPVSLQNHEAVHCGGSRYMVFFILEEVAAIWSLD